MIGFGGAPGHLALQRRDHEPGQDREHGEQEADGGEGVDLEADAEQAEDEEAGGDDAAPAA